jgi:hypothetical protein
MSSVGVSTSLSESLTYEASRALQSTWGQPDKIHWDRDYSFRDSPYRLLHHQKGIIGTFRVQLLEARNLQRTYWSALALGPVKHLGLSKAHGSVSAYCTLELKFPIPGADAANHMQKPPPASPKYTSAVVPNHNNPVWPHCEWDIPLKKNIGDGAPILLHVEAIEDASATERIGFPLGPSDEDRVLGMGDLDITSLCLGEDKGQTQVGVLDVWLPLQKKDNPTGEVRVLVSYVPNGLNPQPNDLVALEAFARRSLAHSSCPPVVPPLQPLKVLQERGSYLLVEYRMRNGQRATLRINRKSVFVIERFNIIDGAVNLALAPADIFLSTSVGRATQSLAAPLLDAGGEVLMPVILSVKLVWGAFRTTGFAALSGVTAVTSAVWNQSREAHDQRQREKSFTKPVHVVI